MWWYFSYRNQKTAVGQPNFIGPIAGKRSTRNLWNPSGKATYQINQNNKLIGYYQWGQKDQPNRLPQSAFNYTDPRPDAEAAVRQLDLQGRVERHAEQEHVRRSALRRLRLLLPAHSPTATRTAFEIVRHRAVDDADRRATRRNRPTGSAGRLTGSVTYFKDGWGGSHNFKVGGEMLLETGWYGYTQVASGNVRENVQQRHAAHRDPLRADGDARRQPRRRPERQPAERRQAQHLRRVHHRPVVGRPRDVQPRRRASITTTSSRRSRGSSPTPSRPV